MEKSRDFYSYPIYDALSPFILDEIIYYDFIYKFFKIFNESANIHYIIYSLNKSDISKLKEIAPYANIYEGEEFIRDIDKLLKQLLEKGKVKVKSINMYYCEKCDEHYNESQVKEIKRVVRENIAKVRIGKRIYFIGDFYEDEEPIGVYLGYDDKYALVELLGETWLAPYKLKDFLINELEVPKNRIRKVSFEELENFDFENYVVKGSGRCKFIIRGDVKARLLKRRLPSYSVIYSKEREVPIKVCPRCGNVLKEEYVPALVVKDNKKTIYISSPEGSYKLPVLYCPNCGHIEYGSKIKDCPVCGSIMERRFALKPELSALGAYIHNFKEPSPLMFLHQRRSRIKILLEGVLKAYYRNLFIKTIYLAHKVPSEVDEVKRAVLLLQRRGEINQSNLKKVQKLRNIVENIVRYVSIYGATSTYEDIDEWLEWKNNQIKLQIRELGKGGKISEMFQIIYDYIVEDISHFYIPLKRKNPLVLGPIKDSLIMLYPYMPNFAKENLNKLGIEDLSLEVGETQEMKVIDILREFLRILRKYREKMHISKREPLKKVVFVTPYADDIEPLKPLILNVENILIFQVTEEWNEMEIEIEPNMEEISASYRAWAPKIAFLLRRKNMKEIVDAMEKGGYTLGIEGFIIKITPNMIKYIKKVPEGYKHIEFKYGDIYIQSEQDATTQRIKLVREIIRRINSMRKDIEMDFDDLIDVSISGDPEAIKMIRGYDDEIREKCLARNIEFSYTEYGYIVEWPIMGYRITIGINPLFKRWVIKAFKSIPGIDDARAELLFNMGYGSVYDLMEADPEQLADTTGIPINLARDIIDYIYSTAFKPKKEKNKEYCPFCGAELAPEDDFCPRCGAPIRVKIEEKRIKKGNVYLFRGDLDKMMDRIPEDLMKERKMLITKDDPEEIKKRYELKNVETLWISYVPFGNTIKPKELDKLKDSVLKFLDKGGKLIIVDCFDLLLAINGLDKLLQMIGEMKEKLKEKEAYLFFNIEELEAFEMGEIMKYVDGEVK